MTMKKTSKYTACYYNPGVSDILLSDIGLKIRSKHAEDLFALNPLLKWDDYQKCLTSGTIFNFKRMKKLVELGHIPELGIARPYTTLYDPPGKPIPSRSRSLVMLDQSIKNYVDTLEDEFLESEKSGVPNEQKNKELTEKFIKEHDLDGFSDPFDE